MERDITISRDYFFTLLRRAELHGHDDETLVTISKSDYDSLLQHEREYKALKSALLAGGTTTETLEVLIATSDRLAPSSEHCTQIDTSSTIQESSDFHELCRIDCQNDHVRKSTSTSRTLTEDCVASVQTSDSRRSDPGNTSLLSKSKDDNSDYFCSVVLHAVPALATVADVVKVVRGGKLFNAFINRQKRLAYITFAAQHAASNFMAYAKESGIYVRDKQVTVVWDDHQRYISNYIANCIRYNGATRNIVIRFPRKDITAEVIRQDLEHIHYLEVVWIVFDRGHAWVSTNSIRNAITARSCLVSQLKYKKSKIEFFPDECDEPLPKATAIRKLSTQVTRKIPRSMISSNRYESLAYEEKDDSPSSCATWD